MTLLSANMTRKDGVRFRELIQRGESTGCWIWNGTTNNRDYPLFYLQGKMVSALKLQYELSYQKPVPKGEIMAHHCGHKNCVKPDHLYTTTRSALYTQEFVTGKRTPSHHQGALNPNAKLTAQQVMAIREQHSQGDTITTLATQYDVTPVTISCIVNYRLWNHVE